MIITPFKMSLYKVKYHAKYHWGSDILIYKFEFEKNVIKEKNNILKN